MKVVYIMHRLIENCPFKIFLKKEMSFCRKLEFFFLYLCTPMSLIFQTMNSVRSNSLRLKYYRFTPSGYKDKEIRKLEFVAKIQFLCKIFKRTIAQPLCKLLYQWHSQFWQKCMFASLLKKMERKEGWKKVPHFSSF